MELEANHLSNRCRLEVFLRGFVEAIAAPPWIEEARAGDSSASCPVPQGLG